MHYIIRYINKAHIMRDLLKMQIQMITFMNYGENRLFRSHSISHLNIVEENGVELIIDFVKGAVSQSVYTYFLKLSTKGRVSILAKC